MIKNKEEIIINNYNFLKEKYDKCLKNKVPLDSKIIHLEPKSVEDVWGFENEGKRKYKLEIIVFLLNKENIVLFESQLFVEVDTTTGIICTYKKNNQYVEDFKGIEIKRKEEILNLTVLKA